jgi:hypothetical protein
MKRIILTGLTVLTLAVTAASPTSAINPRFRNANQMHNNLMGKLFMPALTSEENLTQRFKDARDANLNKLNPCFKVAHDRNINN